MSSLGYQTVYRTINERPGFSAERVFLPDDVDAFRQARVPLFTLESQREVSACHALAFSVAYELELPGLFTLLELAGLPVFREQRDARHPLVVAGGPLTFSNPDPLEPFVDVIVQGESEDLLQPLLDGIAGGGAKQALLEQLAKLPGFRVPGLSSPASRFFVAKSSDANLPARSQIITANTELRSMFLIEPERGCSRGCHYCVMRRTTNGGMRTVPPERVLELIPENARRVGLVGAAVTDHPRIVELLETIVRSGREVGVSSLRAERLTAPLVQALKEGGARGITVASDGPSQRLRDLVDRKHSEQQIVNALTLARGAGMARAKVYNIVGLPTEEDVDIDELARFSIELSKILPVSLGVAPFAAKRNTPMDGAPFAGISTIEQRLKRLQRGLRGRVEVRPTSARWAWVEYMLAQSGPEGGLAAYDAWRAGGSFAAWKKAFEAREVKPYLAKRVEDGRRRSTVWPMVPAL
ncbi:MAG: radical SAM protein [Myxococcaceae bacterium]|nr:radical SAM protein [Myxococcaceae bacterium]